MTGEEFGLSCAQIDGEPCTVEACVLGIAAKILTDVDAVCVRPDRQKPLIEESVEVLPEKEAAFVVVTPLRGIAVQMCRVQRRDRSETSERAEMAIAV